MGYGYTPPVDNGGGTVTGVTATAPLHSSGGTAPNLTIDAGTALAPGVLQVDGITISVAAGIISTVAGVRTVSVTLTAAQINGMFAAPVQVLPAQGAGTLIVVTKGVANAVFGSAAFTGGGNIALYYGSVSPPVSLGSNTIVPAFLTTFSANQIVNMGGANGAAVNVVVSSIALNKGLFVSNATAPYAVGTGATVTFTIQYYVLSGLQ